MPMSRPMSLSPLPDPVYDPAFYEGVLPKRLFAWMIDVALILAVVLILGILSVGIFFLLWLPIHAAVSFVYRWQMLKARSATLGMRVMNIELRGRTGAALTGPEAALHTATYLIGATMVVVQLISIAMMIGRPYGRSLPDELVGAVMINRAA